MSVFARIAALATLALTGSVASSATFASDLYGRALMPAFEINTIVRSMGFDPTGPAVLRGPVYVIRALDDDDIPLRITVDARSGRVLTVTELAPDDPYNAPGRIGSYPIPPGRVASVPEYRPAPGAPRLPNAAPAPVRQSAATPRAPTPRARPAQTATPGTTASIPAASTTPGKSIPAPVARSAAAPAASVSAPSSTGDAAPAAPNAAAAKTETPMVPVAPLE